MAGQPRLWAERFCARGSTGMRCLLLGGPVAGRPGQAGRGGAPPAWVAPSPHTGHCPAPAALCLPLLRKRREHAQVREVFDVIVAGPLGRISGHGQHVLQEGRKESRGGVSSPSRAPTHPRTPACRSSSCSSPLGAALRQALGLGGQSQGSSNVQSQEAAFPREVTSQQVNTTSGHNLCL